MKSILIPIKPKLLEKILNGKKTIEIRKTIPKCKLPVDVYIYCCKNKNYNDVLNDCRNPKLDFFGKPFVYGDIWGNADAKDLNGKVVAKFTLNKCILLGKGNIDKVGVMWR